MAMTRSEHLLVILAEECSEVSQRVTKALRFGVEEVQTGQDLTNAERIVEELIDLYTLVDMLAAEGVLTAENLPERMARKRERVEKMLAYSASLGLLTSDEKGEVPR